MSVRRLSQSFLSTRGRGKASTFIAGYGFGVDEMDLLQRTTVGAGGTATITFSSIPQTYQHLHFRLISRGSDSASFRGVRVRINGVTTATYARHQLYGDGASATSVGQASQTEMFAGTTSAGLNTANAFGATIIDLLDYTSTIKNPTIRVLGGMDNNGSGFIHLDSGNLSATGYVTSVSLFLSAGNFAQHTVASLYGVVG